MTTPDLRPSHAVLEDVSTQAGLPLHKALEGDVAAGKNAHGALVAKDPSGNLIYIATNEFGEVIVTPESDQVACLKAAASAAGSATEVTVATIPLSTSLVYKKLGWVVSNTRDTLYRIVHNNNGSETELVNGIIVGAGNTTHSDTLECDEFTSGGTGTQQILVKGTNMNALSPFHATVTVEEVQ